MIEKGEKVPLESDNLEFIAGRIKESTSCTSGKDSDFNRFIILTCAIDAISNCWIGVKASDAAKFVYVAFVELCMDGYDETVSLSVNDNGKQKEKKIRIAELLYDHVRCSIDHNFRIGEYVYLTGSYPKLHRKVHKNQDGVIFDVNELEKDIKSAIKKLRENSNVPAPCFIKNKDGWVLSFNGKTSKQFLSKADLELATLVKKNLNEFTTEEKKALRQCPLVKERKECVKYKKWRFVNDVNNANKGMTVADTLNHRILIPRVTKYEENV